MGTTQKRNKMLPVVLSILAVTGLVTGEDNADDKLSKAVNCFNFKLYKELAKSEGNLVTSPFSLAVLLSILRTGAEGETFRELTEGLEMKDLSETEMENAFKGKLANLKSSNGNILEVANSVWTAKHLKLQQTFNSSVKNNFNADLSEVNFNESRTTDMINSWAKDKTHGLIQEIFSEPLSPDTEMVLANAIYFQGIWQTKFKKEKTKKGNFYNDGSKDSPSTVDLMTVTSKFNYNEDDNLNAQVLEMDYVGRNMSMVFILPKENSNIQTLENNINCDSFKSAMDSAWTRNVEVIIPKFERVSTWDLKNTLQNMGLEDMFESSANFSRIAPGICASQVVQNARLKVYEDGSEAAAVTAVAMNRIAPSAPEPEIPTFRADHPFMLAIRDKPTDIILFMAKIESFP